MKKSFLVIAFFGFLFSTFSQTTMKEQNAGHSFKVSLPDYMTKTSGLNDVATIQYKNVVKDVYGFIIYDTKEELSLSELVFTSLSEFYDTFIVDFLKDEKKRTVSAPVSKTVGSIKFTETDVSYYDTEAKTEIYYFVGIVETGKSYYKVLNWCTLENKAAFKADFQKILYSLHD